jgi:hypothetical protein
MSIQKTLDDEPDNSCAADDSTLRRWRKYFANVTPVIIALLTALYMKTADKSVPLFQFDGILSKIRSREKQWLTFVFGLLINSGHRLHTRFAFCP